MRGLALYKAREHLGFWCASVIRVFFPLTPALSLVERVNCRPQKAPAESLGAYECGVSALPLPKGKGWGAGERRFLPARGVEC
jgi:hypothetical protein